MRFCVNPPTVFTSLLKNTYFENHIQFAPGVVVYDCVYFVAFAFLFYLNFV